MADAGVTAFVAGATGFVGRATVEALRARGRVVAHVRPDSPRLDAWRARWGAAGVEVDASPWTAEAMTAALAGCGATHVFGLLGTTRKQARAAGLAGDPYDAIDYQLTRLLVDAAVAAGRRPRLVVLSSVGVGPRATSAYLRAHWRAEEAVRASGLPWVIARPSFIVPGDGARRDDDRPLERLGAAVTDAALAVAGVVARQLRATYRSTTPEVLAAALVRHGLDGPADQVVSGAALR